MPAPYRYKTAAAMWTMQSGTWVQKSDLFVVFDAPNQGFGNWSEVDQVWYQRGAGGTFNDWVKLGFTDKYITVTGLSPQNVVAVSQTGAHNNCLTRVSWTNPVGSTSFNIFLVRHNSDDLAYDGVVLSTNPGDTSYPNNVSGSAAGQHVWYSIHYVDSNGISGPNADSNTVLTNFSP